MNFHILTLFPDMVMGGLGTSITGRAMESKTISVEAIDIRDYSKDKHRHVDDAPYGGGAGMVMQRVSPFVPFGDGQRQVRVKNGGQRDRKSVV